MMPGGHLATSLALAAATYQITGSAEAAAGCIAGGFLIDVDHYLDYLIFEEQWRRPSPVSFLRYYFTNRPRKLVLPLHSFELMTVLLAVILAHPWPLLVGYWVGAAMHLTFDVLVNGEHELRRAVAFYFFGYRVYNRFTAENLMKDLVVHAEAGTQPVKDFFLRWRSLKEDDRVEPVPAIQPTDPVA
ncbi:MAG TPA: hypothetical protein VLL56_00195 [Terriglobia bacterium]|jgi:hypothetical protein|nr:hypothetical protein [Terriglobia bacterium]